MSRSVSGVRRGRRVVAWMVGLALAGSMLAPVGPAFAATGDPEDVAATVEGLNVAVTWKAAAGAGVTGYVVTTIPESAEVTVPAGATSAVLTGVRPTVGYVVSVAAVRDDFRGDPVAANGSVLVKAPGGSFVGVSPSRVLDTRTGNGVARGQTKSVTLQVGGRGGVPARDVSAVVLNVTVTGPTAAGYVTAYPAGVARPTSSNVNFAKNQTKAGLVIVPVSTNGRVILASSVSTHLVADVSGFFTTQGTASATEGLFSPVQPERLMDTRNGVGATTPGPRGQVKIQVAGQGGVPESDVSSVVLNTTVTQPSTAGYVTAYPTGDSIPLASTINFVKGQTVANRTVVPLGYDGSVSFFNAAGTTPIIVDVVGWFTAGTDDEATGSYFVPVTPKRLVDTRTGLGAPKGRVAAKAVVAAGVAGVGTVPEISVPTPPTAAVTTVTLVNPSASTYATAYPSLSARPAASDLNAPAKTTVPNAVVSGLGVDGKIAIFNNAGTTDMVVDLSGYFIGSVHAPTSTVVPSEGQIADVQGDPGVNATVTLAKGAKNVAIGQIVAAGVSPETPRGLLVRVLKRSTNAGGQQVLKTESATLQEALGSFDLNVTAPLSGSDVVQAEGQSAPTPRGTKKVITLEELARRQQIGVTATPVKGTPTTSKCVNDSGSYVQTEFSIEPTLNVEAHVRLSWTGPNLRAKAYAQITETATAGFKFDGKVSCNWSKTLAKYTFPTITFPVGGVPVVIVPELTVKLDAQISGSAKISSSVTQQFTAKAGVEYNGGRVKPINKLSNTLNYQPLALTEAKGSASVGITAELIGKFYGLTGPTITVSAVLSANVNPVATPWWILVFDLTAKAGLHLEKSVIKLNFSTDEFTLLHKVLAQAGGTPSPTTDVRLGFDDVDLYTSIGDTYQASGIRFGGDILPYTTLDGANPSSPVLSGGRGFGDPLYGVLVNPDGSDRTVSQLILDVGYIDTPGSTEVVAYDTGGRLLLTAPANKKGIVTLTLNKAGIHSFVVRSTGVEGSGWAIDNVRFKGFAGSPQIAAKNKASDKLAASRAEGPGSTQG